MLPAKTRAFVDFVVEAFRRERLAERFAGSLGYAAGLFKAGWAELLESGLENLDGVTEASVQVDCVIPAHQVPAQTQALAGVKNVIAVASGYGNCPCVSRTK